MDKYEDSVCSECGYFSSVHPYEEGSCLKKSVVTDRKGRLVFQKVGAEDPACSEFILFQRRRETRENK